MQLAAAATCMGIDDLPGPGMKMNYTFMPEVVGNCEIIISDSNLTCVVRATL